MASQTHSKGGRPTSYRPEYPEALIKYFESFVQEPFTKEVIEKITEYYNDKGGGGIKREIEKYKFVAKRLPTLFGFAREIGVHYATVNRWATAKKGKKPPDGPDLRPFLYPEFREAYNTREAYQTEYLTAVGLGGTAPSIFAIFTAKNVIGWRDTQDSRFVDGAGKDRPVPSYIILPKRLTDEEAQMEYNESQQAGAVESA